MNKKEAAELYTKYMRMASKINQEEFELLVRLSEKICAGEYEPFMMEQVIAVRNRARILADACIHLRDFVKAP